MNFRGPHVILERTHTWRLHRAIFRDGWFSPHGQSVPGDGRESVEPIQLVDGDLVGLSVAAAGPRAEAWGNGNIGGPKRWSSGDWLRWRSL